MDFPQNFVMEKIVECRLWEGSRLPHVTTHPCSDYKLPEQEEAGDHLVQETDGR